MFAPITALHRHVFDPRFPKETNLMGAECVRGVIYVGADAFALFPFADALKCIHCVPYCVCMRVLAVHYKCTSLELCKGGGASEQSDGVRDSFHARWWQLFITEQVLGRMATRW